MPLRAAHCCCCCCRCIVAKAMRIYEVRAPHDNSLRDFPGGAAASRLLLVCRRERESLLLFFSLSLFLFFNSKTHVQCRGRTSLTNRLLRFELSLFSLEELRRAALPFPLDLIVPQCPLQIHYNYYLSSYYTSCGNTGVSLPCTGHEKLIHGPVLGPINQLITSNTREFECT